MHTGATHGSPLCVNSGLVSPQWREAREMWSAADSLEHWVVLASAAVCFLRCRALCQGHMQPPCRLIDR
jgi:hypothetical protein